MKIAKIYDVKDPVRGTPDSAGIDIYIPNNTQPFVFDFNQKNHDAQTQCFLDQAIGQINIHPHGRVDIPTGLRIEVPEGHMLMVANKGGAPWDSRVTKMSEVIDVDYQGNVFIKLFNYTSYKTTLSLGMKFPVQLVCVPVSMPTIEIVPNDQIHLVPTVRGDGANGSTGMT